MGAAQDAQAVMAQDRSIAAGKRDPKKSLDDDIDDPNVHWGDVTNNYPQAPQPKNGIAGKLLKSVVLGGALLAAGSLLGPLLVNALKPATPPAADFIDTDTKFFLDFGEVHDE